LFSILLNEFDKIKLKDVVFERVKANMNPKSLDL